IVFSAGVFGILVGGLIFGYLGDRIGRRLSIVAATVTFGGFSLLTAWAGDLNMLIALRFLATAHGRGQTCRFPVHARPSDTSTQMAPP
ncbi:MAG: MFS transporter, partial [Bradyrhizobium sp.]|nr:MFS transporter [Bradyrhizobium sp.]